MTDRRMEIRRIFKEVSLELTGYDDGEAEAWAQGMIDALTLTNRMPNDDHFARDFAIHAARL